MSEHLDLLVYVSLFPYQKQQSANFKNTHILEIVNLIKRSKHSKSEKPQALTKNNGIFT